MTRLRLQLSRLLVLAGCCLPGCAADTPDPVSLPSWRHSLESYVWNEADGDPTAIADLSWDDVHRGFAVIGDPLPERSTDAIGLLVDHRPIEGRPYFIFLVALVHEQRLEDVRAVALNVDAGRFHWFVGPEDPRALKLYRASSQVPVLAGLGSEHHPERFPAPGDRFHVEVLGRQIAFVHDPSRASWTVELGPDDKASLNPSTRP